MKSAPPPIVPGIVAQRFERGVKLRTLREWPGNPKTHDVGAIVESMTVNGFYGVVYAQTGTRRLLAGHGRKKACKVLGYDTVDVVWLDVDDATGARIVAADNRLVERGGYDPAALVAYLDGIGQHEGTGYTAADVAELRAALAERDAPEPSPDPPRGDSRLVHECPKCGHKFSGRGTAEPSAGKRKSGGRKR